MASFPEPVEYKIVRNVQSIRTYVTELDQSNTPNAYADIANLGNGVDRQLATIVNNILNSRMTDERLKEKMEMFIRPANCVKLEITRDKLLKLGLHHFQQCCIVMIVQLYQINNCLSIQ